MEHIIRTRIAPTPSGYLHLGNAFNFLLTEALVREKAGTLRLRIDDLDAPRVLLEYLKDIFETLHWLGISPDFGPENVEEQQSFFAQQLRMDAYRKMLDKLVATGSVFACDCSRKDILQKTTDGQYPGTCRDKNIPLNMPEVAWRIQTNPGDVVEWEDAILGNQRMELFYENRDFVIRRRDALPAYHVASLSDDHFYKINLIVRGADLLQSTAAQLFLARMLGLQDFIDCKFYHHPLIPDETGEKLSKSAGSLSLMQMRKQGISAKEVKSRFKDWSHAFLYNMRQD